MVASRDRLVEEHLHLVQTLATKLRRLLGKTMEPGDLVGYGTQGLIEAAKKYDPALGTPFAVFANYRIRGAMFDGMRAMGWYSRTEYARFRAEERAAEYLASAGERESSERKAGTQAPKDKAEVLEDIAELLGGVAAVHITSMESAGEIPDERFKAPDDRAADRESAARIAEAVATLPDKEKDLVRLYYYSDMSLEDAGSKLGLSKSWASRLHARAVGHLREALQSTGGAAS